VGDDFIGERFDFGGFEAGGDEGDGLAFEEGRAAGEGGEADAGDALEDEIGSAIIVLNASADEAKSGDLGGLADGRVGIWDAEGEHAMGFEGFAEHVAVAGFKNSERDEVMGEEDEAIENHNADAIRE
jgi:hypothetical protein